MSSTDHGRYIHSCRRYVLPHLMLLVHDLPRYDVGAPLTLKAPLRGSSGNARENSTAGTTLSPLARHAGNPFYQVDPALIRAWQEGLLHFTHTFRLTVLLHWGGQIPYALFQVCKMWC